MYMDFSFLKPTTFFKWFGWCIVFLIVFKFSMDAVISSVRENGITETNVIVAIFLDVVYMAAYLWATCTYFLVLKERSNPGRFILATFIIIAVVVRMKDVADLIKFF